MCNQCLKIAGGIFNDILPADYRKIIVGLISLRYISNTFNKRYQKLVDEGYGFKNDKDAYIEVKHLLYSGRCSLEQNSKSDSYS